MSRQEAESKVREWDVTLEGLWDFLHAAEELAFSCGYSELASQLEKCIDVVLIEAGINPVSKPTIQEIHLEGNLSEMLSARLILEGNIQFGRESETLQPVFRTQRQKLRKRAEVPTQPWNTFRRSVARS